MRLPAFLAFILLSYNSVAMEASEIMQALQWHHRVLIIFTPGADDAQFKEQNAMLKTQQAGLAERDMVIIRVVDTAAVSIDGKQHAATINSFHKRYDVQPHHFRVVLVGKDGTVKLDQGEPVNTDALFTLIDAMPMRQYEMLKYDD